MMDRDYADMHAGLALDRGYAQEGNARSQRPLESLASAALRINTAAMRLNAFVDRFHGAGPTAQAETKEPPPPVAYMDMLQRLHSALDRLETRVEAVEQIG